MRQHRRQSSINTVSWTDQGDSTSVRPLSYNLDPSDVRLLVRLVLKTIGILSKSLLSTTRKLTSPILCQRSHCAVGQVIGANRARPFRGVASRTTVPPIAVTVTHRRLCVTIPTTRNLQRWLAGRRRAVLSAGVRLASFSIVNRLAIIRTRIDRCYRITCVCVLFYVFYRNCSLF